MTRETGGDSGNAALAAHGPPLVAASPPLVAASVPLVASRRHEASISPPPSLAWTRATMRPTEEIR
ncbi:hypothetical protein [Microbacterium lacticum]